MIIFVMVGEVQGTPASVDPAKAPEVVRQRQAHEIQRVASNILQRKIADVNGQLVEKTPQEQEQILDSDKGKNAIRGLWFFGSDTRLRNFRDEQHPEGQDVSKGNRLIVETEEGRGEVHYLVRADGDSVTSNIDLLDRQGNITRPIPREDMVRAHIIAEASRILEQFPQGSAERALLELHIQSLRGENPQPASGQTVDEVVKQAAENTGMLTVDDLRAFVESEFAKLTQNTEIAETQAAQSSPLSPEQAALKAKLLGLLEGRNLADYETAEEIFGSLEYGNYLQGDSLQQYFAAVERGEMDPAKAKLLRDALVGGDGRVFLEAVAEEFKSEAKPETTPQTIEGRFIAEQLVQVERDIAEIEATRVEVEATREAVKAARPRIQELQTKIRSGTLTADEEAELKKLNVAEASLARLDRLPEYQRLAKVLAEASKADGKWNPFVQWIALEQIGQVRKDDDIDGLLDARRAVFNKLPELQRELVHYMYASKHFTNEEIAAVQQGNFSAIEQVIASGKLAHDQELAELFFRKGITEAQITEFVKNTGLTPEQISFLDKHKASLFLLLMLLLKEGVVMANDMILKQESR